MRYIEDKIDKICTKKKKQKYTQKNMKLNFIFDNGQSCFVILR